MSKKALITGCTGQIGSYLCDLLVAEGHEVYGMARRTSTETTERIQHLGKSVQLHQADLLDLPSLVTLFQKVQPDWVVNCAAQSHVHVSFNEPVHTGEVTGLGVLRLLEAARSLKAPPRIVQMSSSEMFGDVLEEPQSETTRFNPQSPYACAKAYAHYLCCSYRKAYGMHVSCAINFNTESERRGLNFVTRKITYHVARQVLGLTKEPLELGNLDAKRDWSYVKDTCRALYLMLQQDTPDDYVLATGETHTVREFVEASYRTVGVIPLWRGRNEKAEMYSGCYSNTLLDGYPDQLVFGSNNQKLLVKVNPAFYRPADVNTLTGDYSKAKRVLGWEPKTKFNDLVRMMVESDLKLLERK